MVPGEYKLQVLPKQEFAMDAMDAKNNEGLVVIANQSDVLVKTLVESTATYGCPTCTALPQADGIPYKQFPGRVSVAVPPLSAPFGAWSFDLEPDKQGGVFTTLFKGRAEGDNACNLAFPYKKDKPMTHSNHDHAFPCMKDNWWGEASRYGTEKVFPVLLHKCPYGGGATPRIPQFMYGMGTAQIGRASCRERV